jgi:hypothetical protein
MKLTMLSPEPGGLGSSRARQRLALLLAAPPRIPVFLPAHALCNSCRWDGLAGGSRPVLGVRIAGSRTGKSALSLSWFDILIPVSRTSSSFQAPLLTRRVEVRAADMGRWVGGVARATLLPNQTEEPCCERWRPRYSCRCRWQS